MTEINVAVAIEDARAVKTMRFAGRTYVQVWYGGTTVNLYATDTRETWDERNVWSISDEKGRPVSKTKIEEHMEMHFELMKESFEAEADE